MIFHLKSKYRKLLVVLIVIYLTMLLFLQHKTVKKPNKGVFPTESFNFARENVTKQTNTTSRQPAYFPVNIDNSNCFNDLTDMKTVVQCGFNEQHCLRKTPSFVPDFDSASWEERHKKYAFMEAGSWAPCDCKPASVLAIIIPYRVRAHHLNVFINNIVPFLQYQRQAFTLFLVEHSHDAAFNRGASFNAAYEEIKKFKQKYDCFIIHDVDMINENLCNYYACGNNPRHLSVLVEKAGYSLYYEEYAGGVLALSSEIVEKINGFSNMYFGWGGEDDNMYARLLHNNYTMYRYTDDRGRYATLSHKNAAGVEGRKKAKEWLAALFYKEDGLTSLNYTLISITSNALFKHIYVNIPGPLDPEMCHQYDKIKIQQLSELNPKVYETYKLEQQKQHFHPNSTNLTVRRVSHLFSKQLQVNAKMHEKSQKERLQLIKANAKVTGNVEHQPSVH